MPPASPVTAGSASAASIPTTAITAQEVIDQGDVWVFRLAVGPDRIGEIRRTAAQLQASGWTLTIPADAADRLPELRRAG